jgi:hypothetical protein
MSTRLVFVTLVSAALLASCAPLHPDIRPEVAKPLNEAMHLSGYWTPNRDAIMAKLNQAASVPNLNSDEQNKIRATAAIALAKRPQGIPSSDLGPVDTRDPTKPTGLQPLQP